MKRKSKKTEQIAARKRHKEQLKMRRSSEPNIARSSAELVEKPLILIVCEGMNTEPSYFRQFRLATAKVVPVGTGRNNTSLVKEDDGKGSKVITNDFFELLDGVDEGTKQKRVVLATVRAERNYDRFDHSNPASEESSTTVFRLVSELLKYV